MKSFKPFLLLMFIISCSTSEKKYDVPNSNINADDQKQKLNLYNLKNQEEAKKANVVLLAPYFESSVLEIKKSAQDILDKTKLRFDAIAKLKPKNITFKTTILALENLKTDFIETLSRISFIKYTSKNKAVREMAAKLEVDLEKFLIEQEFRIDVYEKIHLFEKRQIKLSGVDKRLFDDVLRTYKRQGMNRSKKIRDEIEKLKKQISELEVKISNNIASDKSYVELSSKEYLELPKTAQEVLKKGSNGKYRVRVGVRYQAYAIIDYSPREYLRKKVFNMMVSRQKTVNRPLMEKVVYLKTLLAKKLGYKNWADYRLEIKMAKNLKTAHQFEKSLVNGLEDKFNFELSELKKIKVRDTGDKNVQIESWDMRYYTRLYKKEKFDLDLDQLKKFFAMDNVLSGMFGVFEDIFRLKITYEEAPYVWDELVRLIKITDSVTKKPLGLLYLDLYPRPEHNKYGHFAMFGLSDNKLLDNGLQRRPVAALLCNFPLPTIDKPSLLSIDHVETLFHEFGHALHHILSESKYATFAGTNVPRDFVEAPSQMLENWVQDKNVLDRFAYNYQNSNEKVPTEILKKIKAADKATKAMFYRRQLAFGILDLDLYSMTSKESQKFNIISKTNKSIEKVYRPYPEGSSFITSFGHIFGGYDAGYYGYAWADNIAADMASVFENSENKFLNFETGMKLRKEIYERGSTREINESIEAFLGRKLNSDSFYKKIGIN